MKLRTEIKLPKHEVQLNHHTPLLFCGSCFAENIGYKLQSNKFNVLLNPFGISYNPLSLFQHLSLNESTLQLKMKELKKGEEQFYHYDFHSTLNATSVEEYATQTLRTLKNQQEQLSQKPVIILSLGTAWVYRLKSKQQLVNNCHKEPSSLFYKELIDVETIVEAYEKMQTALENTYQNTFDFIFTISPVRHLKDGFRENQISKATLQLATAAIEAQFQNVSYFPAYELLQDDLRDYRFYAKDLLHPNELAIEYIWSKFTETHLDTETQKILKETNRINQALNHRAFNPSSEGHQKFLKQLKAQMLELQQKHGIDYHLELKDLNHALLS